MFRARCLDLAKPTSGVTRAVQWFWRGSGGGVRSTPERNVSTMNSISADADCAVADAPTTLCSIEPGTVPCLAGACATNTSGE